MSEITKLSIKDLFSSDHYVIPIYQRNYAWGEPEITQLIQDIVDYCKKEKGKDNADKNPYYIGTLIVCEKLPENYFETIDGQQRLTTLSILLSLIKNEYKNVVKMPWYEKPNLEFYCRDKSNKTLQCLFYDEDMPNEHNVEIKQGYDIVKKELRKIHDGLYDGFEEDPIETFCEYLFEKVTMLRVLVPKDTDLNHYFEIMNSRGEQLEKHEILKAKMLKILDEDDRYAFNTIWKACSNMETYVQLGFSTTECNDIFGNEWNVLSDDISHVYNSLKSLPHENGNEEEQSENSILDIINKSSTDQSSGTSKDDANHLERFNTIINFANFLLHILRIQTKQDISLDDKSLIEMFDPYLENGSEGKTPQNFVKSFGYNLLKGKFLFDKYIIKREFSARTDRWTLKRLKWSGKSSKNAKYFVNTFLDAGCDDEETYKGINGEILMLLSMFHVSMPTPGYKHWLNAALNYVFENSEKPSFSAKEYKEYLEGLAKAFLFDNILAETAYFDIIYTNNGISKNTEFDKKILDKKLDIGTGVNNFIFNYLDYLLWQNYKTDNKEYFRIINGKKTINDDRISRFEYTFRSSVEHYYPQHPIQGNPSIDPIWSNNFGNLCLLSASKNSKLSNYMPQAKKDHYQGSTTIDSIKQRIMMEYNDWSTKEIEDHGEKMKELLMSAIIKDKE